MVSWKSKGEAIGLMHRYTQYPMTIVERYGDWEIVESINIERDGRIDLELWAIKRPNDYVPASSLWPPSKAVMKISDEEMLDLYLCT